MQVFPVFYGQAVSLHSAKGWVTDQGSTNQQDKEKSAQIRFLSPGGRVPSDNNRDPKLVSYGDRVIIQLSRGRFVGRGMQFGELAVVTSEPLVFSIFPVFGQFIGQPLSVFDRRDATAQDKNVNSIYLCDEVGQFLTSTDQNELLLSHISAFPFQVYMSGYHYEPSPVKLPLPLPIANSNPGHVANYRPWVSPVQPLLWVPPFIPMHPPDNLIVGTPSLPFFPSPLTEPVTMLEIVGDQGESEKRKKLVCFWGDNFCMPKFLAIFVLIFIIATIVVIVSAKLD